MYVCKIFNWTSINSGRNVSISSYNKICWNNLPFKALGTKIYDATACNNGKVLAEMVLLTAYFPAEN